MVELLVVLVMVGVTAGMSAGRIHDLIIQQRIVRAATAVQSDLEAAFALASRNRRPIRINWSASAMQLGVTDRAGTIAYRHTNLGSNAYGLRANSVSLTRSDLEVYPNGLANDTLVITLSVEKMTKTIRMSRAGLVLVQ
jgi:Tfp pilus assembly protein FimT